MVTIAPFFIALHCGLTAGTLRLASPKNQYGFTLCITCFLIKRLEGSIFKRSGAPAKVFPGMGDIPPNQIDPKVLSTRGVKGLGTIGRRLSFGCSLSSYPKKCFAHRDTTGDSTNVSVLIT